MQTPEWLHAFKLALIEEDIGKMMRLYNKMPEFTELDEMKTAQALIQQARDVFVRERLRLQQNMSQLKKSIEFQKNSLKNNNSRFDTSF